MVTNVQEGPHESGLMRWSAAGERFSTKRPDTFTQTVPSPNFKPLAVRRRTIHLSVMAFHEKAGRSQVGSFFILLDKGFSPAESATVAMLPSALSRSDSFRSVHVGRSRYSRCCHLFSALWFCSCRVEPGPGH